MIINTPLETKVVDEYDIATGGGLVMPVTIDPKAGDTFEESDSKFTIHIAPRQSMNDPMKSLPAENITIYKSHVISINHRTREVPPLTPEQQFEWNKTLQEMISQSVH